MSVARFVLVAFLPHVACDAAAPPRVQTAERPAAAQPLPDKPRATTTLERGFEEVAARVAPAVVSISSQLTLPDPHVGLGDPLLEGLDRPRRVRSEGSGVLVTADGLILTNHHVVDHASRVVVQLADGTEREARVVGGDPRTDVAVLDIEGTNLPHVQKGDSDDVHVGEFVLAIGNPFGVGQTVTLGIISAVGRGELGIVDYEDFLQTDAAINPGSSGGALVNARGELIGISTAILTGGARGNQGVGFAVPTKMAYGVLAQIERHGRVIRGWLGTSVQDVTPSLRTLLALPVDHGALVSDVAPDSPAARAGLHRGDVVVAMDGAAVPSSRALRLRVSEARPGTTTTLDVLRGGRRFETRARLGELPDERDDTGPPVAAPPRALGIAFRDLEPALRRHLSIPRSVVGALVVAVEEGGRADQAGLAPGDVVLEVDRRPVRGLDDVEAIARAHDTDDVLFLVWREGATRYVVVER